MKDKNILICVGIIIYIAMSGIDRFVYHIPNIIYIPVAILGIALILIKNSIFRNSLIFQGLPPIKYQNLMYFPLFLPL